MGLWKSKNPAPSRKRSILKSPKGKPTKVAFHIDKDKRPKSRPSTPKAKSSSTRKFVKCDANTGPSQVCFRDDVVEGDGTPINEWKKSNKSVLCRSSLEFHEHGRSRRQSKTRTEEVVDRPKVLHGKKSYLEDKTHSIYAWLEQSEKAMKKCTTVSKQSLERELSPYIEKKPKSLSHTRTSTGDDDGSNKAQVSDTNDPDQETPIVSTPKKLASHRNARERNEQKSKAPRLAHTKKDSIDMDKVIKQRIFNALDKRELMRLAAKKQPTHKKTVSKVEKVENNPEDSRKASRSRGKALHRSKSRLGNYEKSRKELDPEKRSGRRSRRDLKSRPGYSSSSDSPLRVRRSRSRKSRKKIKRSKSKKVRKSRIKSKNSENRDTSEAELSEGVGRTIKFAKAQKKSKFITESDKDTEKPDSMNDPAGHSSDDVPEAPSMTDLRDVPVYTYTTQVCTIPIIDEKNHRLEISSLNPQGDCLQTGSGSPNQDQNEVQTPSQHPQNRGDDLTRINIDFSVIKCSPRKQIRQKSFLPGVPTGRLNTQPSIARKEDVFLHRTRNDTDLTDGIQHLRRSKPCTSLVENLKALMLKCDDPLVSKCNEACNMPRQTIMKPPAEGQGVVTEMVPKSEADPVRIQEEGSISPLNRKEIECDAGDMQVSNTRENEELKDDNKQKSISISPKDSIKDENIPKVEKGEKPLKMQPLFPQSYRAPKKLSPTVKSKPKRSVSRENRETERYDSKPKANNPAKRKSSTEKIHSKSRFEKKVLQECLNYNKVPEGYGKETRIQTKPLKKHGKVHLNRSKSKLPERNNGPNPKPPKKHIPSEGKNKFVQENSMEKAKKSTNSSSKKKSNTPKSRYTNTTTTPTQTSYNTTDYSKDNTGKYSGKYSEEYPGETSDSPYYPNYSSPSSSSEYSERESKSDSTSISESSFSSGYYPSNSNSQGDGGSEGVKSDKDSNQPECTTTETGGICFKLPGRVTHKTTIKVAHFPRSDPICINIPPPPNPCCCPPNPWCCPNPCSCPNPYCFPNPCGYPDPCNPFCPCGCCPPGACSCPPPGGKLLNNCNIYNGGVPKNI